MTVKAEDRPSGSAGDSASVSTPLFRISVGFGYVACACRGGAKRRRSRIKTSTRHGCKRRNFADNNSLEVSDISVFLFEISFLLVEISAK